MMGFSLRKRSLKGQTALILILLAAAALMFFAMTINWGKLAQIKTQTTIAANTSSSYMASFAASLGEQTLQTTMGGRPKICKSTSILVAIIILVIAIVVIIVSWGAATPFVAFLLVLAVAIAAANLALQVLVVQPGLTQLWNKLQSNLSQEDRFIETGISTAMMSAVNDPAQIPDYFDEDVDGQYFGNSNDKISRYGFFYTERLKSIAPPSYDGLKKFTSDLKELVYDNPNGALDCSLPLDKNPGYTSTVYANCCPDTKACPNITYADHFGLFDPAEFAIDYSKTSVTNPCCVPLYEGKPVVNPYYGRPWKYCPQGKDCTSPTISKRIRPDNCGDDKINHVIDLCAAQSPYGNQFPFVYDAGAENKTNSFKSFRELLGTDDEKIDFQKNLSDPDGIESQTGTDFIEHDATGFDSKDDPVGDHGAGIFEMFYKMRQISQGLDPNSDARAPDTRRSDLVTGPGAVMNNFMEPDQQCAINEDPANGIYWKSGDDRFCAAPDSTGRAQYPYDLNCPGKTNGSSECTIDSSSNCGPQCTASNAMSWHDDKLDMFVYGLNSLSQWTAKLPDNDTLIKTFVDWYPQAATLVAPKCGECDPRDSSSNFCKNPVCSEDKEGVMRTWLKELGGQDGRHGWIGQIDQYLKKTYAADNAWCVPPSDWVGRENNLSQTKYMTTDERDYIVSHSGWNFNWDLTEPWGHLGQVAACYEYNSNNPQKFQNCSAALTPKSDGSCVSDAIPAACANLPRSLLDTPQPAFDAAQSCKDGSELKTWLSNSATAGRGQQAQFAQRAAFLKDLFERTRSARDLFDMGYSKFNQFLFGEDAPAQAIMANRALIEERTTKLPNYVIYGWQSSRTYKGKQPTSTERGGNWHIVRVDVYGTGRCGGLPGCQNRMPWVRTYSKGFLGMTRCYEMTDTTGRVYVRVTRFDEEHTTGVNFANQVLLWKFRYSHPKAKLPSDITSITNRLQTECGGVGILTDTRDTLGVADNFISINPTRGGLTNFTGESLADLRGAFMINNITGAKVEKDREGACYEDVKKLLDVGVSTDSCAQYELMNIKGFSNQHMGLKFVKCNWTPPAEK